MSIDSIIDGVLSRESSAYTNDPADRGGPTKYGITQATLARDRGVLVTPEDVQRLTEAEARAIYFRRYVTQPGFGKVAAIDERIGEEVIDAGVLCGQGRAATWLQVALNALNREALDFPDLTEDGDIGPATLEALSAYLAKRGDVGRTVLLRVLNSLQGAYLVEIGRHRQQNEKFMFGWFLNRVAP